MLATSQPQDSTAPVPVALPDLPLSIYRSFVVELVELDPAARDRINRGLDVLQKANIYATDTTGVYRVQSCADAVTHYETTTWTCSCPDYTRRLQACKHVYSIVILHAAHDWARWRALGYTLTAQGEAALAAAR